MKCQDFTTAEDYQDHVEIKAGGEAEKALCVPQLAAAPRRSTRASEPWSKQLGRQKQSWSALPRVEPEDNNYLGKFVLTGLPKTLRGVPKIKADSDCPRPKRPKQSQSSRCTGYLQRRLERNLGSDGRGHRFHALEQPLSRLCTNRI